MRIATIGLLIASGITSFSADLKGRSADITRKIPSANAYYPVVGQSKASCKKQYKEPCQLAGNSDGTETWIYFFAKARLFTPERAPTATLTVLRIDFDSANRVSKWSTSQEKDW